MNPAIAALLQKYEAAVTDAPSVRRAELAAAAVAAIREVQAILAEPPPPPKPSSNEFRDQPWHTDALPHLGQEPDKVTAKRVKFSVQSVSRYRRHLGIPSWRSSKRSA